METIEDIVREMRKRAAGDDAGQFEAHKLPRLADRIEKAYKFMVEGLNGGIVERDQYIEKLTNENERLKAALKPVLNIVMDKHTSDLSMELAIMQAKNIWYEVNKS